MQTPEKTVLTGIVRKRVVLTPKEHGVKKEVLVLNLQQGKNFHQILVAPKIEERFEIKGKELEQKIVTLICDKQVKGVTGYVDKNGEQRIHEQDGLAAIDLCLVSAREQKVIEVTDIAERNNLTLPEDYFMKLLDEADE